MSENIKCTLELQEKQKASYSKYRIEMIEEDLNKLSDIKKGEISFDGIYVFPKDGGLELSFFIRNGRETEVYYDTLPLVIKNENGEIVAAQIFDFEDEIKIPSKKASNLNLLFEKENIYIEEELEGKWYIEVNQNPNEFKTLRLQLENLPSNFDEDKLFKLNKKLKVKKGTFQMVPFEFGTTEEDIPYVIIIMNNGTEDLGDVPVVPITVKDKDGKVIVRGLFEVNVEGIKPMSSKVVTLLFENQKVDLNEFDVENIKVEFSQ